MTIGSRLFASVVLLSQLLVIFGKVNDVVISSVLIITNSKNNTKLPPTAYKMLMVH